ncbi:unnamed protein product [Brassica rapa subsp. trilocularis]
MTILLNLKEEDAGYAVGARVMERLCNREKVLRWERERDTVTWNFIFHEDEYMISEKELLVNRLVMKNEEKCRCISIPKDMGTFNCGAFVAGIVKVSVLLGRFINRVQKWGKL